MKNPKKKILVVVAHPDDESFGMGGTLARYAREGAEIHVLCATHGESGKGKGNLGKIRERELHKASQILGVTQVDCLNYVDGTLCNNLYHEVAEKVEAKIKSFGPHIVLTFDQRGLSGHIDHVFMSLVATYVCRKYKRQLKLFYLCDLKSYTRLLFNYFIYFPPGYEEKEVDVVIDTSKDWVTRVQAMKAHKSQMHDVRRILLLKRIFPKKEYFLAAFPKRNKQQVNDLFDY